MTLGDVSIVEELSEEIQVTGVHQTSNGQNIPAYSAVRDGVSGLDENKMAKDIAADDELYNLDSRDELGNRSGGFHVESTNSKIAEIE